MPRPSRWTAEKRYAIVMEMLRGQEPIAKIARKHQVSDTLLDRWRERFLEGGKTALEFENGGRRPRGQQEALEQQIDDLQKVIGEQTVEIRFLKRLSTM